MNFSFIRRKAYMDEAYMNKVELESRMDGLTLTDEINKQLYEEEIHELQRSLTHLWCCLWTTIALWTSMESLRSTPRMWTSPTEPGLRLSFCTIKYEKLQMLAGNHGGDLCCTKT